MATVAQDGRPLLRVATAGSVDDGKSTLIGRLLYDTDSIAPDQLEQIREATARRGAEGGDVDLALLTDGLRAEREQGITIDVAYRYFRLDQRDLILADTPGHEQYTRNMVTGASTADLGLVLVDVRNGLTAQSRRHAAVCGLLRVPVIWCINKLDLIGFDEAAFHALEEQIRRYASDAELELLAVLPVSALNGDNIVVRSQNTPWYEGPTLLEALDSVDSAAADVDSPLRLPVQWVIRPQTEAHADYRAYAGQIVSGSVAPGDEVTLAPSGRRSVVKSVDVMGEATAGASAPLSIAVQLEDDLDLSRGEIICDAASPATVTRVLVADICWMNERPLSSSSRLLLKTTTSTTSINLDEILNRLEVVEHERIAGPDQLALNDIGSVRFRTAEPIAVDTFADNKTTGALILIDEATNETVGAGLITATA
jgi:sulfate adenylyltransferase large subunit